MNDKKLLILIGVLLLLISIVAGYFFYRLKRQEPVLTPSPVNIGQRQIAVNPSDPIKKFKTDDGVMYQIEGKFVGDFTKRGEFLESSFVVRGDPEEREIKTFIGTQPGSTFFGTYQGSFIGDSSWRGVDTDEVANLIKAGDPVLIRVDLVIFDNPQANVEIAEKEATLDSLIDDFKEAKFDSSIPTDFSLVVPRVAIIQ